jgi:SNF2 family DNA or RNA helicase
MILKRFDFKTLKISFYENDKLIDSFEHSYWDKTPGIKYELLSLLDSESARSADSELNISIDTVYDSIDAMSSSVEEVEQRNLMSPELLNFLEIPPIGQGIVELESKHSFRSKNFDIIQRYRIDKNKPTIPIIEPVVETEDQMYLLDRVQCQACRLIDDYRKRESNDQEDNFRLGGRLKKLTSIGSIEIIGGRLQKEEIEDVSSIRPRFTATDDGGIDLGFDLESGDNEEFEDLVRSSPDFQEILYSKGSGTERKRYVLNEESKDALNSFRKKSHFSREEKKLLLEDPEEYLKGFNLDDYGERVVGLGILYAPKVSVFKDEDGIEWINLEILPLAPESGEETESSEPIPIEINGENAQIIKDLIEESKAQGLDTILFEGNEIIITPELEAAVDKIIKKAQSNEKVGLITKSNIDDITYSEGTDETISPPGQFQISLPSTFSDVFTLKNFQEYGYGWLNWVKNAEYSGCLLADDMGMGKTIQISALMSLLKQQNQLKTSLIVIPPILKDEWFKELKKFIPTISCTELPRNVSDDQIEDLLEYDVIITTYQTLLKAQDIVGKIKFKLIVCDEVQFIKNPASARTQAVLAMQGQFKIASTATPIENSISELWAIMDYSNPGYLLPLKQFNKRYGDKSVSDEEFENNITKLRDKLSPLVLRRLKEDFLSKELKGKTIESHFCMIDEKQTQLCEKVIEAYKIENTISNFLHFFQVITLALTNPELLDGEFGVFFPTDYISPKLTKTIEILETVKRNNQKALIFANRKAVQQKLRQAIESEFNVKVNVINGDTNAGLRNKFTSSFRPDGENRDGFEVLILSPQCAGFGLNLVKANHVIHYLRGFNPAVENQATDRVYRIGQENPVYVHNLVGASDDSGLHFTVDQKLDEMIRKKQDLLKDYLYASRASRISEEELSEELKMRNPGISIDEVDLLEPLQFEVFISALYDKMNYVTSLTPINDFGADCVAIGNSGQSNALIQCKKKTLGSKGLVGNTSVQEIVGAQKIYEQQNQTKFDDLIVITNGYFSDAAKIQASSNNVRLIGRTELSKLVNDFTVTKSDIQQKSKKE